LLEASNHAISGFLLLEPPLSF